MRSALRPQVVARSRSVCVQAQASQHTSSRRSLMAGTIAFGLASMTSAAPALALILDEVSQSPHSISLPVALPFTHCPSITCSQDDEELVEKAKLNRRNKLAAQKLTTREFLQAAGLNDKALNAELVPVQKGIYQLQKAGSQLESGDARAASSTLSEGWVTEFQVASKKIGASEAVLLELGELKAAAGKGDLKASKKEYVQLVASIKAWAKKEEITIDGL
jgi:hypothetical protein